MSKKKLPTVEDSIKKFNEVVERGSLYLCYHLNRIILAKPSNQPANRILIIPDLILWNKLNEDSEFIKEVDLNDRVQNYEAKYFFKYGEELKERWINIEVTEELFNGKIFNIKVKDHEYHIRINKELMPLKLLKAEYNNISYRVSGKVNNEYDPLTLSIQKRFEGAIEDTGFSMIRLFQIL
jgi:hypothetical protein